MSKCPNCGNTLTCGCQKRKLANGKIGCSKCSTTSSPQTSSDKTPTVHNVKINNT